MPPALLFYEKNLKSSSIFFYSSVLNILTSIAKQLPIPFMNSYYVIVFDWPASNYLNNRSPQYPFLWKNNKKFYMCNSQSAEREDMS